jgi:hypothetical protein
MEANYGKVKSGALKLKGEKKHKKHKKSKKREHSGDREDDMKVIRLFLFIITVDLIRSEIFTLPKYRLLHIVLNCFLTIISCSREGRKRQKQIVRSTVGGGLLRSTMKYLALWRYSSLMGATCGPWTMESLC